MVLDLIDQYDFYIKQVILEQLASNQSLEKNPNLRSIINLNIQINDLKQAKVDYENLNQDLMMTFINKTEFFKEEPFKDLEIDLSSYPYLAGQALRVMNDLQPIIDVVYEDKQMREVQKLCFFEFKIIEYLINTLMQIQHNVRVIAALWAKELGINLNSFDPAS